MKNYTILIMSSDRNSVRQFSIRHWWVWLLYPLFFIVVAAAIGGIGYGILSKTELQTVQAKSKQLNDKVESQQNQLEYLDKEMREIRQMANMVRSWLGIDKKKGILGQGGESFNTEKVYENDPTTPSALEGQPPVMATYPGRASNSPTAQIVLIKSELEPIYEHLKGKIKEYSEMPSILPLLVSLNGESQSYWFTSGFGYRTHPITSRYQFHSGLDIAARQGTSVIAPANGVIIVVKDDPFLGNMVEISHESAQIGTLYGHLEAHADGIYVGKKVNRFDVIGYVGNTGLSTGPHLHYGVYTRSGWHDPMDYILDAQPIR